MSGSATKDTRKQIRHVIREQLPELLRTELARGIAEELRKDMVTRLKAIETMVKMSLEKMDSQSAQIQTYLINQIHEVLYKNAPKMEMPKTDENKPETQLELPL